VSTPENIGLVTKRFNSQEGSVRVEDRRSNPSMHQSVTNARTHVPGRLVGKGLQTQAIIEFN